MVWAHFPPQKSRISLFCQFFFSNTDLVLPLCCPDERVQEHLLPRVEEAEVVRDELVEVQDEHVDPHLALLLLQQGGHVAQLVDVGLAALLKTWMLRLLLHYSKISIFMPISIFFMILLLQCLNLCISVLP